ncbi:MAG: hypothetical protein ACYDA1_10445 [Vulcanimicrobiaceae bacterium]
MSNGTVVVSTGVSPGLRNEEKIKPTDIDELLALDMLTLRDHTESAGDSLDERLHADRLRELLRGVISLVNRMAISELRSNVYKTNQISMAFHLRLGFHITRENAKGVEFTATVADLAANPFIERVAKRLRLSMQLPASPPLATAT